jgi:MYXO-CTERM domain-containing protein
MVRSGRLKRIRASEMMLLFKTTLGEVVNKLYFYNQKLSLAVIMATLLFTSRAASQTSQTCEGDVDCPADQYCQWDLLYEMCQNPTPAQEWACEGVSITSNGWCQSLALRCQSNADCQQYYTCQKSNIGATGACTGSSSSDGGTTSCSRQSYSYISKYGACKPGPISCASDSDCPSPLHCLETPSSGVCWASADGTAGCSAADVVKYCDYVPTSCKTNTDCDTRNECVEVGSSASCVAGTGGSSGAEPVFVDGGVATTTVDAGSAGNTGGAGAAATCETTPQLICFPRRVNCTNDNDCAVGELCTDFAKMSSYPTWWVDGNMARACLPKGLLVVFQGYTSRSISNEDDATGSDTLNGSVDGGTTSGASSAEIAMGRLVGNEFDGGADEDRTVSSINTKVGSHHGCSVAPGNSGSSSPWLALFACIFTLGAARRRYR